MIVAVSLEEKEIAKKDTNFIHTFVLTFVLFDLHLANVRS